MTSSVGNKSYPALPEVPLVGDLEFPCTRVNLILESSCTVAEWVSTWCTIPKAVWGTNGSAILAEQRPLVFPRLIMPSGCFHCWLVNRHTRHRSKWYNTSRNLGLKWGLVGLIDPANILYAYFVRLMAFGCHRTCHCDLLLRFGVYLSGKVGFSLNSFEFVVLLFFSKSYTISWYSGFSMSSCLNFNALILISL